MAPKDEKQRAGDDCGKKSNTKGNKVPSTKTSSASNSKPKSTSSPCTQGFETSYMRDQRLPFAFEVGPVMTVGELLAAKPDGKATETKGVMENPTMDELMSFLQGQFEKDGDGNAGKEKAKGDAEGGKEANDKE